MDFVAVVDQVIALLRQRGRVAYRTLQRQFQLDEAALADLLAELRYAHHDTLREDEQGVVWTGDARTAGALPLPSIPRDQHLATPVDLPSQAAPPGGTPSTPDAERRQLTVMFCDLVASTKLASQLDPEDWRDVVRAYQQVCTEVIQRYDGHIAQLLGDGLLVYFGYPQAHEDDAQRAVRAGLGMLAALGDLNTGLQQAKGVQLAIRVGVHTGLVVVGEMGGAGRQEQLALGEVPNVCSRIEGLAAPNTVAVSEATYRLVQGYFACQDLGAQALRGVPESMRIYQALGASGSTSRLDVAQPRGLTPLIGRESEVTVLLERWAQVKDGHGQVVLLRGDAGIGKSRLVHMLQEQVTNEPHTLWECRSLSYFENTALFPLTDLFHRLWRFQAEDTPDEKLGKLEHALSQYRLPVEESVPLFASLLALPVPENRYPPLNISPQRQRQKTLETIIAILLDHAERQPVLFIIEDLHWTYPSTLELIGLLLDQTPTASLLVLLTCRPHFHPAWHHRSYLTEMTVNRLSHAQVAQIITRMTEGKMLPHEVLAQIVEKTDGVPLFVEEMAKAILESGHLKAVDDHYELAGSLRTFAIPTTLHDSLMARLDRLVTAKAVAQYAAVIGRQFAYDVLSTVSQLDEATLQRELGRLVVAEIVYQRGLPPQAIYTFKHALIRDAAYESLLKSTRQQYHQRIAQVLEAQFPETTEGHPELLAHHYTEAGLNEQAVRYWHKAGQRARANFAYVETIAHVTKGLEVLETLPETPARLHTELDMQLMLGAALMATKGYGAPEVERVYTRAQVLCQPESDAPRLADVLYGLRRVYAHRGEFRKACDIAEQSLHVAQRTHDDAAALEAHYSLGYTRFQRGALTTAATHLEHGIACSHRLQHPAASGVSSGTGIDVGLCCRIMLAWVRCVQGSLEHAVQQAREVVQQSQAHANPYTQAYVLSYAGFVHHCCRQVSGVHDGAARVIPLCREHKYGQFEAYGMHLRGWALVHQGQAEEGLRQLQQSMPAIRALWKGSVPSPFLALCAEAYATIGQSTAGLRVLDEALTHVQHTEERYYEAEIHRLKGALLLQLSADNHPEAASCFHHAISIAQNQQAKAWELRAAMSLARLWHQQDKRQEAYNLLAPVYEWFTEGFDMADLQEAKALLDALEG